jgi:hypothetical protein
VPHLNVNQSTVESSESSSHVSSGQSSQSKSEKATIVAEDSKETPAEVKDKCKLKLDEFKKSIKKNMALCDQLDMRDPQCVAEFAHEIYLSMREQEPLYQIDN